MGDALGKLLAVIFLSGVLFLYGRTVLLVVVGASIVFQVGYRIKTGHWME